MTLHAVRHDVLHKILNEAKIRLDHVAVQDHTRELSYAELVEETERIARALRLRGALEGDRIALLLPNSVDFVVAALASMWVGAIFVPLSIDDPSARVRRILDDCAPSLVIIGDSDTTADRPTPFPAASIAELLSAAAEDAVTSASPVEASERPVYAIYTSGTTGEPKGVVVGSTAFGSAMRSTTASLNLNSATRTLCVSPFHFDGSFATLFATLYVGGTVFIRPREALLFPRTFFKAVTSERITYTGFSPSYLRLLLASPQVSELLESELEIVALGGEASSLADVRALINVAPKIRIFNRYGPTETTVAVTHLELTPEIISGNTLPIGLPHDDVAFHLVDDSGDVIVDSNRSGELHISGVQLMDEYWNSPELTKEVLRSDIVTGTTVYKTGDIAYRDSNGLYVYVGRADHVVKRSGVRISLVELSESIRRISGVKAAVCLTYDDDDEVGIVAFVVGGNALTAATVRGAMRAQLPENMVPNHIELVDALPMTGSGKVDERRLLRESELGKQLNERSVQSPKQGGS